MKKIAHLGIEDAFAWGVCQKIRLTGEREISYVEIEKFSRVVSQRGRDELGYDKIWFDFNRDETQKFLSRYSEHITHTDDGIRLNDNFSYADTLKAFNMGSVPMDLIPILLDDNIGEQIFDQEISEVDGAQV